MNKQVGGQYVSALSSGWCQRGGQPRDGARRSGTYWQWGARLLVLLGVLAAAGSSWAADLVVTSADDSVISDGACTLREAITAANSDTSNDCVGTEAYGDDTITFHPTLSGSTIILTTQLPDIADAKGLTIDGEDNEITISGNHNDLVMRVVPGASLTVHHLTIANGRSNFYGGGIRNWVGTLTVTHSTFIDNRGAFGGGIANDCGTATVTHSTFTGNSAFHEGGGITNDCGTLTVTHSTFTDNSADFGTGGGIYNVHGGTLTVTNSTFAGNSARFGGGLYNRPGSTLTVTNSTFTDNSADSGAGSGIYNNPDGTVTLRNTIMANSLNGANCFGSITDDGGNLADDESCNFNTGNSTDPLLDSAGLQDNGGPTQTIALQPGSPAIDAALAANCPATDQRGFLRPVDGDGNSEVQCDIGAVEHGAEDNDGDDVPAAEDCDDNNPAIHPGASEVCNGIDDNCDGQTDEGVNNCCLGHPATIVGTNGIDVILGTPGADVIVGKDGIDTIGGLGGNDLICGGDGADIITGGFGNDTVDGGAGLDTCLGTETKLNCELL